jgi:DNA invertase Pin-like site-specific DNA recombinase
MRIGYARVSNGEPHLEQQLEQLKAAGCDETYADTESGEDATGGAQLANLRCAVRSGDTVVITALDRLGRSRKELLMLAEEFKTRGVELSSLRESFDTSTQAGAVVFGLFDSLARMDREFIGERTKAGMERARQGGAKIGRPRVVSDAMLKAVIRKRQLGWSYGTIAKAMGLKKSTVVRYLHAVAPDVLNDGSPSEDAA